MYNRVTTPLGDCLLWDIVWEITKMPKLLGIFSTEAVIFTILTNAGLGDIFHNIKKC
jgi:hypothetical protein